MNTKTIVGICIAIVVVALFAVWLVSSHNGDDVVAPVAPEPVKVQSVTESVTATGGGNAISATEEKKLIDSTTAPGPKR